MVLSISCCLDFEMWMFHSNKCELAVYCRGARFKVNVKSKLVWQFLFFKWNIETFVINNWSFFKCMCPHNIYSKAITWLLLSHDVCSSARAGQCLPSSYQSCHSHEFAAISGRLRTNDSTNSRWTKSSVTNIFLVQEAISLGYMPQKERKDNFYFMSTLSGLEKSSMHH